MLRRQVVALIGGTAVAWPLAMRAQQPGRSYRVGGLLPFPRSSPQNIALFDELRRQGFAEGQNLTVDPRGYGLRSDQFQQAAMELAKAGVDVILAGGNSAILAAQQATVSIPILGITDDMVGAKLAISMARPGGNTTGVSLLATELDGKRQEILIELVPGAHRIAALADTNTTGSQQLRTLEDAARAHDIELLINRVSEPEEIIPAIDAAKAAGAVALNVLASPLLFAQRRAIIERSSALRLPAMYQWPETAAEGGLAGYGPSIVQLFRDVLSRQLIKLLHGEEPADIPIEQPTKFQLVINLETAKTLGITVSPWVLDLADEVIEQ